MPTKKTVYGSLILFILLPRAIRFFYPYLFIEDDFYITNAFLISAGERPYHDFILNHFPCLETFLASLFSIFGCSLQTAEITTQIFVIINSLLIFSIGRRAKNDSTGCVAALLYSCSSLIFRYHVFEREIFTTTCILSGTFILFYFKDDRFVKYLLLAAAFGTSFLIKITGALPLVAIILYFFYKKNFRGAFITTILFLCFISIAVLVAYERYGHPFYFQVFLFHFFKGSRLFLGRVKECIETTDLTLFFGGLGFLFYRDRWRKDDWMLIKSLFIIFPFFFIFLSSTIWSHNLLDMLPFASLLGAALIIDIKKDFTLRSLYKLFKEPDKRQWALLAVIIVLFFFIKPWKTADSLGATSNSTYGFGNIPRKELETVGQYINLHTSPEDFIFSPFPIIAVCSNRKTILNYWENIGVTQWTQDSMKQNGFRKTVKKTNEMGFVMLIRSSLNNTYVMLQEEVKRKNIKLVVKARSIKTTFYLPLTITGQKLLDDYSGEKLLETENFEVFTFVIPSPHSHAGSP